MNNDFYEDVDVKISIRQGIAWGVIKNECIVIIQISDGLILERIKYWIMSSRNLSMKGSAYKLLEIAGLIVAKSPFTIILKHTLRIFPMPIRNKLFFDIESAEDWVKKESKLLNQL